MRKNVKIWNWRREIALILSKDSKLILYEIKKSSRLEKVHIYQLLYYLYFLKHEKGIENVEGLINYPSKRKVVEVKLTQEKEL